MKDACCIVCEARIIPHGPHLVRDITVNTMYLHLAFLCMDLEGLKHTPVQQEEKA